MLHLFYKLITLSGHTILFTMFGYYVKSLRAHQNPIVDSY